MIFDNVWNGKHRKRTVAKRSARSRLAQTVTADERQPWKVTPEIERLRSAPLLSPVYKPWGVRGKASPKRGRRFASERDRRNQRLSTRASRRRSDRARSMSENAS